MMRGLLYIIGWIAVGLAAAGVLLPLLPTTPFALLALACFARSSERSRAWLLASPTLGPVLRDYLEHRVIAPRTKLLALALLWPSIGYTATQAVPLAPVGWGLFGIAAAVSLWLLSRPSRRPGSV